MKSDPRVGVQESKEATRRSLIHKRQKVRNGWRREKKLVEPVEESSMEDKADIC
jgi:hypothetical protein